MNNILELASNIANISQDIDDGNSFALHDKVNEQPYFADVQHDLPLSSSYIKDYESATTVNCTTQEIGKSKRESTSLLRDIQKKILDESHQQDTNFDFLINDLTNSPLSLSNISTKFEEFLDELSSSNFSKNEQSSISSGSISDRDSGVFVDQSNTTVNGTNDESTSITSYHCNAITCVQENDTDLKKPDISYVEMIAKCMLASGKGKVALSEIYEYILKSFPYFENAPPAWRISVRHHLSTCESFVKVGRVPLSRGFYWAIHPACKEDFERGVFDRKLMRKRIGSLKPQKRTRTSSQMKQKTENQANMNNSKDKLENTRNNIPALSNLNSPCVATVYSAKNQEYHLQQNISGDQYRNDQTYLQNCTSVYNRLSGLADYQPKSSTPIRGCPSQQAKDNHYYPVHTGHLSNISRVESSFCNTYQNTIPYSESNSYSSYYNSRCPGFSYTPNYLIGHSYNSAYSTYDYGSESLSGKMSQRNSERYSPY